MKQGVLFTLLIIFIGCGVQKNIVSDPYVGTYNVTVFNVDTFGDIPLEITISKEGENYSSAIKGQGEASDSVSFEVNGTSKDENNTIIIEAYAGGYDIYIDLIISGDDVKGSLMGMFNLEGVRIKSN